MHSSRTTCPLAEMRSQCGRHPFSCNARTGSSGDTGRIEYDKDRVRQTAGGSVEGPSANGEVFRHEHNLASPMPVDAANEEELHR